MTLSEVRAALAELLERPGWIVYDALPSSLQVPCVLIGLPDRIDYDPHFSGGGVPGTAIYFIPIRVYVSQAILPEAVRQLDAHVDPNSAESLKALLQRPAIYQAKNVGSIQVNEASGFGEYAVAGVSYLGFEIETEVWA